MVPSSTLTLTNRTSPVCPWRATRSWPVAVFHTRTVRSAPPVITVLPSLLRATDLTHPACLLGSRGRCPVAASHNHTPLSQSHDATVVPSPLRTTAWIGAWPFLWTDE